jgi:hypothetical protein
MGLGTSWLSTASRDRSTDPAARASASELRREWRSNSISRKRSARRSRPTTFGQRFSRKRRLRLRRVGAPFPQHSRRLEVLGDKVWPGPKTGRRYLAPVADGAAKVEQPQRETLGGDRAQHPGSIPGTSNFLSPFLPEERWDREGRFPDWEFVKLRAQISLNIGSHRAYCKTCPSSTACISLNCIRPNVLKGFTEIFPKNLQLSPA